jgi:hypothetical protein
VPLPLVGAIKDPNSSAVPAAIESPVATRIFIVAVIDVPPVAWAVKGSKQKTRGSNFFIVQEKLLRKRRKFSTVVFLSRSSGKTVLFLSVIDGLLL